MPKLTDSHAHHPDVERQLDDGELLPVLMDAYGEAKQEIAELKMQLLIQRILHSRIQATPLR